MTLFVLFPDISHSKLIWQYDFERKLSTDFLTKLETKGQVYTFTSKFSRYQQFNKSKKPEFDKNDKEDFVFDLEDIKFDNLIKSVYDDIKSDYQFNGIKKFIVIGLEQGCHYANYFANRYNEECLGLILIGNRRLTKDNFEKYEKQKHKFFKSENKLDNDLVHNLVLTAESKDEKLEDNLKEIDTLDFIVNLELKKQYDNLPNKMMIKTFIFNRLIKNCKLNDKKIKYNNQIKLNSKGLTKLFNVYLDEWKYLIYDDDTKDDIFLIIDDLIKI
jgi:hypothetical protein